VKKTPLSKALNNNNFQLIYFNPLRKTNQNQILAKESEIPYTYNVYQTNP
jgi:hypothetical protein